MNAMPASGSTRSVDQSRYTAPGMCPRSYSSRPDALSLHRMSTTTSAGSPRRAASHPVLTSMAPTIPPPGWVALVVPHHDPTREKEEVRHGRDRPFPVRQGCRDGGHGPSRGDGRSGKPAPLLRRRGVPRAVEGAEGCRPGDPGALAARVLASNPVRRAGTDGGSLELTAFPRRT